ncbi:hypothetical protein HY622_00130 [Candidatus Uhrbacteria bacterium]|nr:hypothetical protein [Candidatus Uhrbacteria bacterium]
MRESHSSEQIRAKESDEIVWKEKLENIFPLETLKRFFERTDIRRIFLAAIIAIPACAPKLSEVAPVQSETAAVAVEKTPAPAVETRTPLPLLGPQNPETPVAQENADEIIAGTLEKQLPPDFRPESSALHEAISHFTDEELARAHISREELAAALSQLLHVFIKFEDNDIVYPAIEHRLFRDGIRYYVEWDDAQERPFGEQDARTVVDEAMQELHQRTDELVKVERVRSSADANVILRFRDFGLDEDGVPIVSGGRTGVLYTRKQLPLVGEYVENIFDTIQFNLNKDLMGSETNNIQIVENKTGREFTDFESFPREAQRDLYAAYFKRAVIHETIHRLIGFAYHNDELPTSIMNSIAHLLLALSNAETSSGEKKLRVDITTDMEDPVDPVFPLIRACWLILSKAEALEKVPEAAE